MKITTFLFVLIVIFSCTNNNGGSNSNVDTTAKPVTVTDIRNAEPKFPGFFPQKLNILDTMRYLRVILNNDKMVKAWMVYHDRIGNFWNILTWQGRGSHNRVLVDTIFNQFVGINNSYEDLPTFYMAGSNDNGKTWEALDMSLAPLTCKHPTLLRHAKSAQLIVSNDFTLSSRVPSITIAWQWNHRTNMRGTGLAANHDFSTLCEALQELKINR